MPTKHINDLNVASQDHADKVVIKSAATIVNGQVLFTASGAVEIIELYSECVTANDITASTLQYNIIPTIGTATTISGASASLASAVIGTLVVLDGTTLATAPTLAATGVAQTTVNRGIIFRAGTLTAVVGIGSTTGTWKHYIKYRPIEVGATVV